MIAEPTLSTSRTWLIRPCNTTREHPEAKPALKTIRYSRDYALNPDGFPKPGSDEVLTILRASRLFPTKLEWMTGKNTAGTSGRGAYLWSCSDRKNAGAA